MIQHKVVTRPTRTGYSLTVYIYSQYINQNRTCLDDLRYIIREYFRQINKEDNE